MEQDILLKTKIKYTGTFSYKEVYRLIYDWFLDHGYDLSERRNHEILSPDNTKEVDVEFETWKKVSDYFRYFMKTRVQVFKMTNTEVEIDGEKQKMNKGTIEVTLQCFLEKDYENRVKQAPIAFLRTFYDRYLIKDRVREFEEGVIGEMDALSGQIKSHLNITKTR